MSAKAAQALSDPGAECAEMFDMAARESIKAWQTTAMLSRVRQARMGEVLNAFGSADPAQIANFLSNLAGTPFDGYAMKSGADAGSLLRMGRITMKALCKGLPKAADVDGVLDSVGMIFERTREWVAHGQLEGCGEDIDKISKLMGNDPRVRLGLMAPFSPAIAITQFIARASKAQYPFQNGSL